MNFAALPLALAVATVGSSAGAEDKVSLCYGYGCAAEAKIRYVLPQLAAIRSLLAGAENAARERTLLALAVGVLYAWAGQQSPIANDRGGDYADEGVVGRMDCIDHAQSTTRLLRLIEGNGWLHFHRVLEPVRRTRFVVAQHFSAVVQELPSKGAGPTPASGDGTGQFVIDSWFYDNGWPAVVLPLKDWMNGAGPDV